MSRILVIDDERSIRNTLKDILEFEKYQVELAEDGFKALELLKKYDKLFVFVTHDPVIALLSDCRVIMKNGAMQKIVRSNPEERIAAETLKKMDEAMLFFRTLIRSGQEITTHDLEFINK